MKKSIQSNFLFNKVEADRLMEKIIALLKASDCSDDFTRTQIEIIQQLIKSGSRFGLENIGEPEMKLYLSIEDKEVTVEVKIKVAESDYGKLEDLDRTIQEIRGHQGSDLSYIENLRQEYNHTNKNSTDSSDLSELVFDAGVDIDFYVNEEDILNLSAVRNMDPINDRRAIQNK